MGNSNDIDTGLSAGFAQAHARTGMTRAEVMKAYARYRPSSRKMLLSEFLQLRLYDPDVDATHFIGSYQAARIAAQLNHRSPSRWFIGNKLLWDGTLRGLGFDVPELQATFGVAAGPDVPTLATRSDLRGFLARTAHYPLFGKPVHGQASKFSVGIDGFDAETAELVEWSGARQKVWNFLRPLENRLADRGYLFQSAVRQHPEIESAIGRAVGCLRFVTFQNADGVSHLGVAWKLPAPGAWSDASRFAGMAAMVDIATGEVEKVLSNLGPAPVDIESHPVTGASLIGYRIPNWSTIVNQVSRAAAVLHNLPLVGWDVAIGPDGPIFIEANGSPSLWALQIGRSKGIYTPELQDRFQEEQARQKQLFGWTRRQKSRIARSYDVIASTVAGARGRR